MGSRAHATGTGSPTDGFNEFKAEVKLSAPSECFKNPFDEVKNIPEGLVYVSESGIVKGMCP